jgi:CHASE2 domain-containing sensor protein
VGRSRRTTLGYAALAAFAVAFTAAAALQLLGGLSSLERSTLQARFQLRDSPRPRGIVIVAIDERTFGALRRRWPFPRSLHAAVIDRLHSAGAREIVYDVQFTEPTTPEQDNALIESIGRAGGAALATTTLTGYGRTPVLGGESTLRAIHAQAGWSAFSTTSGGTIERMPFSVGGVPALAVVAATRATGRAVSRDGFGRDGALIDFQGQPDTISFSDVLAGRFPRSLVRGSIVLVGATAPRLQDLHSTPTGSHLMAGVQLQANALWTVLHGVPLREAPEPIPLLLLALAAAVAPLARLRGRPISALLAPAGAAAAYVVAAQVAFDAGTVLPVVTPLCALLVSGVGMIAGSELVEAAARRALARQLHESQLELIHRLGQAAESRDHHTGEHLERIARLTSLLGRAAGMSEHDAELLRHASLMHDIGKIGVPDRVLLKPGPLDDDERLLMSSHTTIGGDILAGSELPLVRMAEAIARSHHEHWNGTGYPAGLRGDQIPLAARVCAVCDVFDALVTERPYKRAWSVEEAEAELRRMRGGALDPALVDRFLALLPTLDAELLGSRRPAPPASRAAPTEAPARAPAGS